MTLKPKAEPRTIKQPLVQVELPPRKSRHNKEQVMARDFNPEVHDLAEVGIRRTNMLHVAAGPTVKKGLKNGGVDHGIRPDWWSLT